MEGQRGHSALTLFAVHVVDVNLEKEKGKYKGESTAPWPHSYGQCSVPDPFIYTFTHRCHSVFTEFCVISLKQPWVKVVLDVACCH